MPLDSYRNTFGDNILRGLNAEEVNILRRLLHRMDQQVPINPPTPQPIEITSPYSPDGYAPEVYVVETPSGGIPAAVLVTSQKLLPGVADCQVYEFVPDTDIGLGANGAYLPVYDFLLRVFNIRLCAIPGLTFLIAKRDKYGYWVTEWIDTDCVDEIALANVAIDNGYASPIGVSGSSSQISTTCCGALQAGTWHVTLSGGTGPASALNGTTFDLTNPGGGTWLNTNVTMNGQTGNVVTLGCQTVGPNVGKFTFASGPNDGTHYAFAALLPTSGSCPSISPVVFAGMIITSPGAMSGQSITATITQ